MSGYKLDQIVKGAPLPGTSVPAALLQTSSSASLDGSESSSSKAGTPRPPTDPLAVLPSSPPQIYLNLLILEASLRSQYLLLRERRRQNTFFLLLLAIWIASFAYLLFLRPREDGSGIGGSVYWVVEMGEKVALMGGVFTGMLIWGTGQWDRGVRWPRRWVGIANRGLRSINAKIVVIKGPWWKEMLGDLAFLFPYSAFFPQSNIDSNYAGPGVQRNGNEEVDLVSNEEDHAPGGDYIKLLLLPKPFSPDFRENWELYRLEYWEKENERRSQLRHNVYKREGEISNRRRCSLWWTRWWRRNDSLDLSKGDFEKSHHRHHLEKESRQRLSLGRTDSHSRNASRSSTPSTVDLDERYSVMRPRRGSSTASASERKKRAKPTPASIEHGRLAKLTPVNRPA